MPEQTLIPMPGDAAILPSTQPEMVLQQPPLVYDLSREDLVIRTYFTEPSIATKMHPLLDMQLYSDPLNREIIRTIRGYIRKYNRAPSAQELVTGMANSGYADNVRNKLVFICNAPCTPLRKDYCVAMLEGFYQEQTFERILMKQAEALHNHDTTGIKELIPKCRDALNFSLHASLGLNMINDAPVALGRLNAGTACIPSRLSAVRLYTTQKKETEGTCGGWFRKALSLFIGQPNVGKSMILCSESAFAVSMGYNVLYISLEMAEEKVWHRVVANLLDTDLLDVLDMDPEKCKEMLQNAHAAEAANVGIFNVKRMKTTTTPDDIEVLLDEFYAMYKRPVDLLVIDYLGIMKPARRGGISEENMFRDGEMKAEQIRDLCDERNIACLSAIQFNRTGYRNLDAGMESVSGSAGYNNTADLMITITHDQVLKMHHLYAHMIVKNRMGDNDVAFCAKHDFKKMRWYDATPEDAAICDAQRAAAIEAANTAHSGGGGSGRRREPPPPKDDLAVPQQKQAATAGTPPSTFPADLL